MSQLLVMTRNVTDTECGMAGSLQYGGLFRSQFRAKYSHY